ncbi:cerebellin [Pimephales promelas]|nr:cerebellin [Pimephales promelas]
MWTPYLASNSRTAFHKTPFSSSDSEHGRTRGTLSLHPVLDQTCKLAAIEERLRALETRDKTKVAFSASLGLNGFSGPVKVDRTLVYKNVIINVGEAYDPTTGIVDPRC